MRTLLGYRKPSALAAKRHSLAVLTTVVRTKLAAGRPKRDDESARAANASINIVHCVYRSILRSNSSSKVIFSEMFVRTVSINR